MQGEGRGFSSGAGDSVEITAVSEDDGRTVRRDGGVAEPLRVIGLEDAEGGEPEEELFHEGQSTRKRD